MSMQILGVDVSDKSSEEINHIIETLGLRDLSKESMNELNNFPKELRENWIENPDSTGSFTDDSVKNLAESFESKINESKIYSEEYASVIKDLSQKAYDAACGSYESSIDRQFAHYDNFLALLKESSLDCNDKELNFLSEQVSMGNYDELQSRFKEENISKNGGKFIVIQPDGVTDDIGNYLRNRTLDIEDAVGDELGLPDTKNQTIFVTPSLSGAAKDGKSSFVVYYSNELPNNASEVIKNVLLEEIHSAGYDCTKFEIGNTHPILDSELSIMNDKSSDLFNGKPIQLKQSVLEHAQSVLDNGYDEEGYNDEGYDDTGRSKDGDYNPMYDKAYTDQGLDF